MPEKGTLCDQKRVMGSPAYMGLIWRGGGGGGGGGRKERKPLCVFEWK